ncbi:Hypothetical predicted protein [Paramuricea clavata]|uniref:Uncharacterized protein n=1 Tax=Paramuricea clavata TaxID=317549 RepID=A0A7D9L819_PARCT|nr:Hypothetical predicted protein [Paramuricea clavata]
MLIPGAPVEEEGNLEHLKLRNSWAKIKVDLLVLNQDNLDILQVSNISGQVKNSEFIFNIILVLFSEVGTNDLTLEKPETVGSRIDDLVRMLLGVPSVRVVGVCLVTNRASSPKFNEKVAILNQYLTVVLEDKHNVFCWRHKGFTQPTISPFLPDGVHYTRRAQYTLYRSYRGAILKAIQFLSRCA